MGSIYAGLLASTDGADQNQVCVVDLWQEHIKQINDYGLRVEGASGDRMVDRLDATTDIADAGTSDLFIIATKASGVGPAAQAIAPYLDDHSLVLTIQNGLGGGERIAEFVPTDNVLLGVAEGFGASIKAPGHAHHNAMNLIRIGELGGGMTERLQRIVAVWQEAGFKARAFGDINQLIWEKYLCNCTYSAPCTVFDCTIGELMSDSDRFELALKCALEVYEIGKALKINFNFDDPVAYVTEFGARMPHARPSMLLDHHAKRPSEIDAINGMALVLGADLSIPTPYNETLSTIVRDRERRFRKS